MCNIVNTRFLSFCFCFWPQVLKTRFHLRKHCLYSPAQFGQMVMSSHLYLQCNDCEECGSSPPHICNSGRKCRLSTILTRYIYINICGRKGKRKIWIKNERHTVHCHCDKNAFSFLPALPPLKVALVTWPRRCSSNAEYWYCCFVSICQSQVLELSVAQRDAEQRRVADSSSAQESLLSVTAKYRWL